MTSHFNNPDIAETFSQYPPPYRDKLLQIRTLILQTATQIKEIDALIETLKWGEPSYLCKKKNIGTTIRIHWLKKKPTQYGIYFNCQTDLISQFKNKFPHIFKYEGKRAIIFQLKDDLPLNELKKCISLALTYHINKT